MVFLGLMMLTGWMNNITGYLSGFGTAPSSSESASAGSGNDTGSSSASSSESAPESSSNVSQESTPETSAEEPTPAPDFTLTDQFGETHTLSDYKGKTVVLNFGPLGALPCRAEMPEIQELYEEYGYNQNDVIIRALQPPDWDREGSEEEVTSFLSENGYGLSLWLGSRRRKLSHPIWHSSISCTHFYAI